MENPNLIILAIRCSLFGISCSRVRAFSRTNTNRAAYDHRLGDLVDYLVSTVLRQGQTGHTTYRRGISDTSAINNIGLRLWWRPVCPAQLDRRETAATGRKPSFRFGAGDGKKQTFRITTSFRRAERRLSSARASDFRRANPRRSRKADHREEVELDEAGAELTHERLVRGWNELVHVPARQDARLEHPQQKPGDLVNGERERAAALTAPGSGRNICSRSISIASAPPAKEGCTNIPSICFRSVSK